MRPSGKEQDNIMRSTLFVMLAALALTGCGTTGGGWEETFTLRAVNRSNEILQDVIIRDVDTRLKHFGYTAPSGGENVIEDCTIVLNDRFGILFHANGQRAGRVLALSKYFPVRDKIKTLCFYYLGKYEWSVVARDAAGREVKTGQNADGRTAPVKPAVAAPRR
jgi:hypothetical protein